MIPIIQKPVKAQGAEATSKYSANSTAAQRARLLEYLQLHKKITTLEARKKLDVMHPAGRIQELREEGEIIITHKRIDFTPEGRPHRVAEYVLMIGQQKTPVAAGVPGNSVEPINMGEQPRD